jgi:alpha-L-fucosidase 2
MDCAAKKCSWLYLALTGLLVTGGSWSQGQISTARKDGRFQVDTAGVVSRSDVVLLRPNRDKTQAMPLGNGRLGLAVWSEDGYTAQLNREDTWPQRLSPGQVAIPGLKKMTSAADYRGRLDLYDGEFIEKGAHLTAVTYVDESSDVMVVEVTGADPRELQQVELKLWPGRNPVTETSAQVGVFAETWRDTNEMGASGLTFGSLSGLRVDAREPHVVANGALSIKIAFRPKVDGSFRVLVASPEWRGGDGLGTATAILDRAMKLTVDDHRTWWHKFWQASAIIKLSSPDHAAEYFENLRTIDLFATAAENRDHFPGNQAGIGDLFSAFGDDHHWGPSAYWHWNLRMQVSANLGAGLADFNKPYFTLYSDNTDAVAKWTREHMGGRKGLCIPETMRFNGPGYENQTWLKSPGLNCTEDGRPYYNARTISTGAEVSLWIWQQYQYTDDKAFLEANYPLMREAARFLLAYARRDKDGKLYTYPSNAHESNWDVRNPTTDVAAMQASFPVVIEAATVLGVADEDEVVKTLRGALKDIPALPLRSIYSTKVLATYDLDDINTVVANSYTDDPIRHNEENIGLEPVWPYGLIGDDGPLHALGVRTFLHRPNKAAADWSADAVQAARLGLGNEMKAALLKVTESYQRYPSGFAQLTTFPEFYVEQIGVVADAVQSALVQDYDGMVRVAPAVPNDWDADGTVVIRHGNKVHFQVRGGKVMTVGVEAVRQNVVTLRNPWPGREVQIRSTADPSLVLRDHGPVITLQMQPDVTLLLAPIDFSEAMAKPEVVSGLPADQPRYLGSRSIGLGQDATENSSEKTVIH